LLIAGIRNILHCVRCLQFNVHRTIFNVIPYSWLTGIRPTEPIIRAVRRQAMRGGMPCSAVQYKNISGTQNHGNRILCHWRVF